MSVLRRLEKLEATNKRPEKNPWLQYFGSHPETWPDDVLEDVAFAQIEPGGTPSNHFSWELIYSIRFVQDREQWHWTRRKSADDIVSQREREILDDAQAVLDALRAQPHHTLPSWLDAYGTPRQRRCFETLRSG